MSKTYLGIEGDVPKNINKEYFGDENNKARLIQRAYKGDENNVARKIYEPVPKRLYLIKDGYLASPYEITKRRSQSTVSTGSSSSTYNVTGTLPAVIEGYLDAPNSFGICTYIRMANGPHLGGSVIFSNKLDLSKYSKLHCKLYRSYSGTYSKGQIMLVSDNTKDPLNSSGNSKKNIILAGTNQISSSEIDISDVNDQLYVAIALVTNGTGSSCSVYLYVKDLYLYNE